MGELRSVVEEALARDPRELADDALGERLLELERGMGQMMGAYLDTLAEFEQRQAFQHDRFLSARAWLVRRGRLDPGDASARLRAARRLGRVLAGTRAALRAGDVTWAHARVISEQVGPVEERLRARAGSEQERAVVRGAVAEAEGVLLGAAADLSPRDVARVARRWRHLVDQEGLLADDADRHEARRLDVSVYAGDRLALDGELYGEQGQVVETAISALARPAGPHDRRTPKQRRADALVELCRRALDGGDLPQAGGEKPHVVVEVSLDTLERRLGCPPGELSRLGPIPAETARRLACDASITRVITDPAGEPLDVSRKTRVVPAAIRRALTHRDQGCVWEGCDMPPEWTDAHHVQHWADGGPTSLANLVLLCRRHHRELHEGRELERRGLRRPPPPPPPREPADARAGPGTGGWTGPPDERPW